MFIPKRASASAAIIDLVMSKPRQEDDFFLVLVIDKWNGRAISTLIPLDIDILSTIEFDGNTDFLYNLCVIRLVI